MKLSFEQKKKILKLRFGEVYMSNDRPHKTPKEKKIFRKFVNYIYGLKPITQDVISEFKKEIEINNLKY